MSGEAAPTAVDGTHDPELRSWVESANVEGTDFPIQNLPFGVFVRGGPGAREPGRVGVAIGDRILDLKRLRDAGLLRSVVEDGNVLLDPPLNSLMAQGPALRRALRRRLSELLREGNDELRGDAALVAEALVPMSDVELRQPCLVQDYTDFYAGIEHALNVGRMLRPDEPLLPNYKYVPIAYHGRTSTLVPSGVNVLRPLGQTKADGAPEPTYGPTGALDFELELAIWIGRGNGPLGKPIPIENAEESIFGIGLLNDWSARDIQTWEYRPLGPFLAKSFATSVSPWMITLEALAPFRAPAYARPPGDPAPLPYLSAPADRERGGIDVTLEAWITTSRMRKEGIAPVRLTRVSFLQMYWTPAQMVTHHASNGCKLRAGDLLGSGTVSGRTRDSWGSLLELTRRGSEPIALPTGEVRGFLEDWDEVILRGHCERPGYARIGLGECRGTVLPVGRFDALRPQVWRSVGRDPEDFAL